MKKFQQLALLFAMSFMVFACDKDDDTGANTKPAKFSVSESNGIMSVEGSTAENYTFSASNKYLLKGFVYVKSGATLTIEPGTIIKGDNASKGTLIIERGAKIMAEGTEQKPIVFTSNMPKGQRQTGDWGGLIILGNAPVNLPGNPMIEGGVDRPYGGINAADNSGVLKYVRIEFSGIAFQPDNEINGLTLGGVGSGTQIDYVQVSFCGDDSYEMFGGTVNAKHLIAYKTVDDMLDMDNGYSGKIQYFVGIANPSVADASGSNGIETDNDASGSDNNPKTSAIVSNMSLFGPMATSSDTTFNNNFKRGIHIRRNSNISVHNSLVAGWPVGLLLDGSKSQANATANTLKIQNTVISGTPTGKELTVASGTFNVDTWYKTPAKNNMVELDNVKLGIAGSFNQSTRPDFTTGSSLQSGASFTGMDSFFTQVTHIGAFGSSDWTANWANFDPNNADY